MVHIKLKKGKEKAAIQHHPWVFSGALAHVVEGLKDGDVVKVLAFDGEFLGYGYFNQHSRIAIRMLDFNEESVIDRNWYSAKLDAAIQARLSILNKHNDTCRLVFSEADYLPGLIVDQYQDYLSVQISSSGIAQVKQDIIALLVEKLNPKGIYEKSDASARQHEGLSLENGLIWGEAAESLQVLENGINYQIHIAEGQKSGFYCDQRDNRHIVAQYAKGKKVLDCFSYSGGFTLNCLKAGAAHVTSVDSSALAIETLAQNLKLNKFKIKDSTCIQADVNKQLRAFAESEARFDLIVLDPPKYAPTRGAVDRAARAYKDLNRLAMNILQPGGLIATFSCSGAVDIETFKQIIAWAALDAGREVQILKQLHQPEDHPIRLSFPEGEYLKGLLIKVL